MTRRELIISQANDAIDKISKEILKCWVKTEQIYANSEGRNNTPEEIAELNRLGQEEDYYQYILDFFQDVVTELTEEKCD